MRGIRFLILLVICAGLGGWILLRRIEARSGGRKREGQGLHGRVRQDRRADRQIGIGRQDDAEEDRQGLAGGRADRDAARRRRRLGPDEQSVDARDAARHRRQSRRPRRIRPVAAAHRSHLQGGRQGTAPADWPQDAGGHRPLCQARRSEARLPDPFLRRSEPQQDDVRSSGQDGAQDRARQGRSPHADVAEARAAVRQG